jgi:hypothetical protein
MDVFHAQLTCYSIVRNVNLLAHRITMVIVVFARFVQFNVPNAIVQRIVQLAQLILISLMDNVFLNVLMELMEITHLDLANNAMLLALHVLLDLLINAVPATMVGYCKVQHALLDAKMGNI